MNSPMIERGMCIAATIFATLGAATAQAMESEFQIGPRVGRGELRIDAFEGVNEEFAELDTYGVGVTFGFLTPIGVVLQVGTQTFGNFDLFDADDEFIATEHYVSVGYQFELGDGWRIVPQVGRSRWKLESEEGWLFFLEPAETSEIRGYDYFWELGVGRRISDVVTLGLSIRSGSYDYGRSSSAAFVATFGF